MPKIQPTQERLPQTRATSRSGRYVSALIVALAMLSAACGGGDDPVAADDTTPADVYTAKCARCHGENLEGAFGPALTSLEDRDEAELIEVITSGKNSMPSWGGRLTDAQILEMVVYLRGGAADS